MPRWFWLFALLVLALSVLCIRLGIWQSNRYSEKVGQLEVLAALADDPPFNLEGTAVDWGGVSRFVPVRAVGRYRSQLTFLLDNRIYNGQAGYEVYSYFELNNPEPYSGLWVNRGWVAHSYPRKADNAPLPPSGWFTIHGVVDRPDLGSWQEPPGGQALPLFVNSVDFAAFNRLAALPDGPAFAVKLSENQPGSLPRLPDNLLAVSPQRHLVYAGQWFLFAAVGLAGLVFLGYALSQKRTSR